MKKTSTRAQLARELRRYPVEGRCIGPKPPAAGKPGSPPAVEGPYQPKPTIGVHASIFAAWALVKLCARHQQFDPEDAVYVCRREYEQSRISDETT